MNILNQIIADKRKEVAFKKSVIPVSQLETSVLFERTTLSLKKSIEQKSSGIIAEFKRRSPSKSTINQTLNIWDVAKSYEEAGVAGMSILTDGKYFGGSLDDLLIGRSAVSIPLLRKDFMVDEYQILEAKAFGADLILLIAAVLGRKEIERYSQLAQSLGMEVLLEVHNGEELEKSIMPSLDLIGVNNRNLKSFEVSLESSFDLASKIPSEFVKVSESGISEIESIQELQNYGYRGFLIGENFMKSTDLGQYTKEFIQKLEA